jgi:mannose-6-phosphate isomerase-like protein (cupin superfamily)
MNIEGKPQFDNGLGETVVEISGLAVDERNDRSWAIANYRLGSYSRLHYHEERTEDYFITAGIAEVIVDGQKHLLHAGETIRILPRQAHQVINVGNEPLNLVVRCVPAWVVNDQHFIESPRLVPFPS